MNTDRIRRINEMIRRELAMAVFKIGAGEEIDPGSISFVDVNTSRDLRSASVLVSVMSKNELDAEDKMKWLWRHRVEFQSVIAKNLAIKYTPKLFFKQTMAISKGDRTLGILNELEAQSRRDSAPESGVHAE